MIIKGYAGCPRSQTLKFNTITAYLRNAPEFWKTATKVFSRFEGDLFWLKKIFERGLASGAQF